MKRETVANRVFTGYPWKGYRALWETTLKEIHKAYPLHFLAIGREEGQPAEQLLTTITEAIRSSSQMVFDATTGNPNVSLEYGYARAIAGKGDVYLFLDDDAGTSTGPGRPIIADLAGSVSNHYQTSDGASLARALRAIADRHPYTKFFRRVCRQRGYRGGTQKFVMRIIRKLDGEDSMLRRSLVNDLTFETKKDDDYVVKYITELHKSGLLTITRGNHFSSRVSIAG